MSLKIHVHNQNSFSTYSFLFVCLFVYSRTNNFQLHPAAVTVTGARAENLDLRLTPMPSSNESPFVCHMNTATLHGFIRRTVLIKDSY
jgi:hypothetical protein